MNDDVLDIASIFDNNTKKINEPSDETHDDKIIPDFFSDESQKEIDDEVEREYQIENPEESSFLNDIDTFNDSVDLIAKRQFEASNVTLNANINNVTLQEVNNYLQNEGREYQGKMTDDVINKIVSMNLDFAIQKYNVDPASVDRERLIQNNINYVKSQFGVDGQELSDISIKELNDSGLVESAINTQNDIRFMKVLNGMVKDVKDLGINDSDFNLNDYFFKGTRKEKQSKLAPYANALQVDVGVFESLFKSKLKKTFGIGEDEPFNIGSAEVVTAQVVKSLNDKRAALVRKAYVERGLPEQTYSNGDLDRISKDLQGAKDALFKSDSDLTRLNFIKKELDNPKLPTILRNINDKDYNGNVIQTLQEQGGYSKEEAQYLFKYLSPQDVTDQTNEFEWFNDTLGKSFNTSSRDIDIQILGDTVDLMNKRDPSIFNEFSKWSNSQKDRNINYDFIKQASQKLISLGATKLEAENFVEGGYYSGMWKSEWIPWKQGNYKYNPMTLDQIKGEVALSKERTALGIASDKFANLRGANEDLIGRDELLSHRDKLPLLNLIDNLSDSQKKNNADIIPRDMRDWERFVINRGFGEREIKPFTYINKNGEWVEFNQEINNRFNNSLNANSLNESTVNQKYYFNSLRNSSQSRVLDEAIKDAKESYRKDKERLNMFEVEKKLATNYLITEYALKNKDMIRFDDQTNTMLVDDGIDENGNRKFRYVNMADTSWARGSWNSLSSSFRNSFSKHPVLTTGGFVAGAGISILSGGSALGVAGGSLVGTAGLTYGGHEVNTESNLANQIRQSILENRLKKGNENKVITYDDVMSYGMQNPEKTREYLVNAENYASIVAAAELVTAPINFFGKGTSGFLVSAGTDFAVNAGADVYAQSVNFDEVDFKGALLTSAIGTAFSTGLEGSLRGTSNIPNLFSKKTNTDLNTVFKEISIEKLVAKMDEMGVQTPDDTLLRLQNIEKTNRGGGVLSKTSMLFLEKIGGDLKAARHAIIDDKIANVDLGLSADAHKNAVRLIKDLSDGKPNSSKMDELRNVLSESSLLKQDIGDATVGGFKNLKDTVDSAFNSVSKNNLQSTINNFNSIRSINSVSKNKIKEVELNSESEKSQAIDKVVSKLNSDIFSEIKLINQARTRILKNNYSANKQGIDAKIKDMAIVKQFNDIGFSNIKSQATRSSFISEQNNNLAKSLYNQINNQRFKNASNRITFSILEAKEKKLILETQNLTKLQAKEVKDAIKPITEREKQSRIVSLESDIIALEKAKSEMSKVLGINIGVNKLSSIKQNVSNSDVQRLVNTLKSQIKKTEKWLQTKDAKVSLQSVFDNVDLTKDIDVIKNQLMSSNDKINTIISNVQNELNTIGESIDYQKLSVVSHLIDINGLQKMVNSLTVLDDILNQESLASVPLSEFVKKYPNLKKEEVVKSLRSLDKPVTNLLIRQLDELLKPFDDVVAAKQTQIGEINNLIVDYQKQLHSILDISLPENTRKIQELKTQLINLKDNDNPVDMDVELISKIASKYDEFYTKINERKSTLLSDLEKEVGNVPILINTLNRLDTEVTGVSIKVSNKLKKINNDSLNKIKSLESKRDSKIRKLKSNNKNSKLLKELENLNSDLADARKKLLVANEDNLTPLFNDKLIGKVIMMKLIKDNGVDLDNSILDDMLSKTGLDGVNDVTLKAMLNEVYYTRNKNLELIKNKLLNGDALSTNDIKTLLLKKPISPTQQRKLIGANRHLLMTNINDKNFADNIFKQIASSNSDSINVFNEGLNPKEYIGKIDSEMDELLTKSQLEKDGVNSQSLVKAMQLKLIAKHLGVENPSYKTALIDIQNKAWSNHEQLRNDMRKFIGEKSQMDAEFSQLLDEVVEHKILMDSKIDGLKLIDDPVKKVIKGNNAIFDFIRNNKVSRLLKKGYTFSTGNNAKALTDAMYIAHGSNDQAVRNMKSIRAIVEKTLNKVTKHHGEVNQKKVRQMFDDFMQAYGNARTSDDVKLAKERLVTTLYEKYFGAEIESSTGKDAELAIDILNAQRDITDSIEFLNREFLNEWNDRLSTEFGREEAYAWLVEHTKNNINSSDLDAEIQTLNRMFNEDPLGLIEKFKVENTMYQRVMNGNYIKKSYTVFEDNVNWKKDFGDNGDSPKTNNEKLIYQNAYNRMLITRLNKEFEDVSIELVDDARNLYKLSTLSDKLNKDYIIQFSQTETGVITTKAYEKGLDYGDGTPFELYDIRRINDDNTTNDFGSSLLNSLSMVTEDLKEMIGVGRNAQDAEGALLNFLSSRNMRGESTDALTFIPVEIQKYLGVIHDPVANYELTMRRIGRQLSDMRLVNSIENIYKLPLNNRLDGTPLIRYGELTPDEKIGYAPIAIQNKNLLGIKTPDSQRFWVREDQAQMINEWHLSFAKSDKEWINATGRGLAKAMTIYHKANITYRPDIFLLNQLEMFGNTLTTKAIRKTNILKGVNRQTLGVSNKDIMTASIRVHKDTNLRHPLENRFLTTFDLQQMLNKSGLLEDGLYKKFLSVDYKKAIGEGRNWQDVLQDKKLLLSDIGNGAKSLDEKLVGVYQWSEMQPKIELFLHGVTEALSDFERTQNGQRVLHSDFPIETLADVQRHATTLTSRLTMNMSNTSPLIKLLSRSKVVGVFPALRVESLRITFNTAKEIAKRVRRGDVLGATQYSMMFGGQLGLNFGFLLLGYTVLDSLSQELYGGADELDEDVKEDVNFLTSGFWGSTVNKALFNNDEGVYGIDKFRLSDKFMGYELVSALVDPSESMIEDLSNSGQSILDSFTDTSIPMSAMIRMWNMNADDKDDNVQDYLYATFSTWYQSLGRTLFHDYDDTYYRNGKNKKADEVLDLMKSLGFPITKIDPIAQGIYKLNDSGYKMVKARRKLFDALIKGSEFSSTINESERYDKVRNLIVEYENSLAEQENIVAGGSRKGIKQSILDVADDLYNRNGMVLGYKDISSSEELEDVLVGNLKSDSINKLKSESKKLWELDGDSILNPPKVVYSKNIKTNKWEYKFKGNGRTPNLSAFSDKQREIIMKNYYQVYQYSKR